LGIIFYVNHQCLAKYTALTNSCYEHSLNGAFTVNHSETVKVISDFKSDVEIPVYTKKKNTQLV